MLMQLNLLHSWKLSDPCCYFVFVFTLGLIVRIIICLLRAFDKDDNTLKIFTENFKKYFLGFYTSDKKDHADHWLTFILGILELSIYPILIVTQNWSFIGAWLAYKAVAQWKVWEENRNSFNRFLIGNLIVLLVAYFILTRFIEVS